MEFKIAICQQSNDLKSICAQNAVEVAVMKINSRHPEKIAFQGFTEENGIITANIRLSGVPQISAMQAYHLGMAIPRAIKKCESEMVKNARALSQEIFG